MAGKITSFKNALIKIDEIHSDLKVVNNYGDEISGLYITNGLLVISDHPPVGTCNTCEGKVFKDLTTTIEFFCPKCNVSRFKFQVKTL